MIEKSDESMDCESNHDTEKVNRQPKPIYFDAPIYYSEHLDSNDKFCWMTQRQELTDKMETIKLDQPLDLSLRHNDG